jgi:hypothetical protein
MIEEEDGWFILGTVGDLIDFALALDDGEYTEELLGDVGRAIYGSGKRFGYHNGKVYNVTHDYRVRVAEAVDLGTIPLKQPETTKDATQP